MFKIIGADHNEYGPASAEEIREWIRQGRADGRTMARTEPDGAWKSLAEFPEFADLTAAPGVPPLPAGAVPADVMPPVADLLARDYQLDIGSCFSRSWALMQQNFWLLVGVNFLVVLVMECIMQAIALISRDAMNNLVQNFINKHEFSTNGLGLVLLTTLLNMIVQSVFMAGLYKHFLNVIRGQDAPVSDAFSGLIAAPLQLSLLGLVMGGLILLGTLLCVIPGLYLSVAWFFAMPLIIDRKMGFWEAMQLSMKMVNKHWFTVFAMLVVVGLASVCGLCALCIGIFVTMPLAYVALMYAYEDIFGRQTT